MYERVLLAILVVAMPLQGDTYLTIQESVLAEKINVVFENLIQDEWYRFNWTDNPSGYFFQYSGGQQTKELTLTNPYGRAYFVFELYYDAGNEMLVQTTRFWGDPAPSGNGEFKIPFLGDALDFITSLTFEEIMLMVLCISFILIFNFFVRRGR